MVESKRNKMKTPKKPTAAKKRPAGKSTPKKVAAKPAAPKKQTERTFGIRKEPKSGNVCAVTFTLPKVAAPNAKNVCIVGDFNNWNIRAHSMQKVKNGDYVVTLNLEGGKEYQFRYLIDESTWENDWNADRYVKNPYGDSDNSVVSV